VLSLPGGRTALLRSVSDKFASVTSTREKLIPTKLAPARLAPLREAHSKVAVSPPVGTSGLVKALSLKRIQLIWAPSRLAVSNRVLSKLALKSLRPFRSAPLKSASARLTIVLFLLMRPASYRNRMRFPFRLGPN
jgi:hypothetical protein